MIQFAARPISSVAALPTASFKHSAKVTDESTLLDPRVRETLYEKVRLTNLFLPLVDISINTHTFIALWQLPLRGRPLSYAEILRRWTIAVIKKQRAIHSIEEAQEECEDYASDIIAVVGQDEYDKFLASLLGAIKQCPASSSADIQGCGDI